MSNPVLAFTPWETNAHMIVDVVALGYLRDTDLILDPTYGRGGWWKLWEPAGLVFHDLKLDGVDFRDLPYATGVFDAVAFDPPYKLNGTPTAEVDERYGVDVVKTWQERHVLIAEGMVECARVLKKGGYLLLKCQDQVSSGHVRWQTDIFTRVGIGHGLTKVDRLDMLGGRAQPDGRRQVHARRNASQLLVFVK